LLPGGGTSLTAENVKILCMKHNPPSPDKSGYGGQALRSPTKFYLSHPYFFLNPFRQVKFFLSRLFYYFKYVKKL
jgi:hypothetical protein